MWVTDTLMYTTLSVAQMTPGGAMGGAVHGVLRSIVDLKSGRVQARHREDLRFYALVETLSRRVPPRLLASFYLDSAQPITEDVTEGLLRSALRRTLDGINALVEIKVEGRPAVARPGASCRWCPLATTCAPGQAYLNQRDDNTADADAFAP